MNAREPERWRFFVADQYRPAGMSPREDGEWVKWADVADRFPSERVAQQPEKQQKLIASAKEVLPPEDLLEIFIRIAEELTHQRDRALRDAHSWKHEFEMYRSAWLREMGGKLYWKAHDIDSFVKTTRIIYQKAQQWDAYQNGLLGKDPFWMVPDPKPVPDPESQP